MNLTPADYKIIKAISFQAKALEGIGITPIVLKKDILLLTGLSESNIRIRLGVLSQEGFVFSEYNPELFKKHETMTYWGLTRKGEMYAR